jgi:AcrR family transcriptional regulator
MPADTAAHDMLNRTIAVIETDGEEGVRVVDIAKHVGVAVTTLFHLFGNRDSLIMAAQIERYVRGQASMIEEFDVATAIARTKEDFRAVVIRMVRSETAPINSAIRQSRQGVFGSAYGQSELMTAITSSHNSMCLGLQVALERAKENGWIEPTIDTLATAYWMLGLLNSRVFIEAGSPQLDRRAWDDLTLKSILRVLFVD